MKYVRYALLVLFLVPIATFYARSGWPVAAAVAIFWCAIPLTGLLTRGAWFFYYVYVVVPLGLALAIVALWLLSQFGDQAYGPAAIAALLWPVLLYCAAVVVLTVVLHKNPEPHEG